MTAADLSERARAAAERFRFDSDERGYMAGLLRDLADALDAAETKAQRLSEMTFSTCPDCGAEYPDFYSPIGSLYTFCDRCGYTNDPRYLADVDGAA